MYTFPDNKPVEDLLRRISSKPFSASFDKQLNAVNDICSNTFVTNFSGYDLYNFCNEAKQYYSKDIVERIKDIAIIQLEKYRDVLVSISDKDTIKNEYNRSELEQNIFNPTKSTFNMNIAQSLNIDKEERE